MAAISRALRLLFRHINAPDTLWITFQTARAPAGLESYILQAKPRVKHPDELDEQQSEVRAQERCMWNAHRGIWQARGARMARTGEM